MNTAPHPETGELLEDDAPLTDEGRAKIKPQFIINRQGKQAVLYAGLLDAAHQEGLSRVDTEMLQFPHESNNFTSVVKGTVTTSKGTFSNIGDANADNVGRMIAMHTIRMAATRAVARALRDAINVGVVASEELRQDEPAYQPRHQDRPAPQPRQPAPSAPTPIRQAKELQDTDPAPAKWLKVLSDLQDEIHALTGAEVAIPDALSVEGAKRLKADMVGKIEAAKAKKGAQ